MGRVIEEVEIHTFVWFRRKAKVALHAGAMVNNSALYADDYT